MAAETVSLIEHQHLSEMHDNLRRKLLESQRNDSGGRMDTVRAAVMAAVVGEHYEGAKDELKGYIAFKAAYPSFQERANRYVAHCCDLIEAIKIKRNFPGLASLSLAKQQEIHEKVLEHFEELKQNLRQIEKVEREHKINDMRSTVWVLKTLSFITAVVMATALVIDMRAGYFSSFFTVADRAVDDASTWIVNLIHF